MASIKLKVITPEKVVIELETYQATLPVEGGEVTILPNHMPYIGAIQAGGIILRKEASGEEISLARAEEARRRAEELKKETVHMGEEEYARTAALLEKELTRVKVARKHHTRRGISLGNGGF